SPRTPSVPKSRSTGSPWSRMRIGPGAYAPGPCGDDSGLSALAVLRRLASLLQAGLAAFLCPRIAGEEAGLLQQGTVVVGVCGVESARDAEAQRAGLTGDPTSVDTRHDVVLTLE